MENIDLITQEPIPEEYLIKFTENNKEFIFDVRTLVKDYIFSGYNRNPFTRCNLPDNVIESVKKYMNDNKVDIYYCYINDTNVVKKISMCTLNNLAQTLLNILREESLFGYIGSTNFEIESLEVFDNLHKSLLDLDLSNKKIIISQIKTVYDKYNVNVSWFRYFDANDFNLCYLIDFKYHIKETTNNIQINHSAFEAIINMIKVLIKFDDKIIEEKDFIKMLRKTFGKYRISCEQAREIIKLTGKNGHNSLNGFLMSIVADKYNLDKNDILEGLYAIPKKVGDINPANNEHTVILDLFSYAFPVPDQFLELLQMFS